MLHRTGLNTGKPVTSLGRTCDRYHGLQTEIYTVHQQFKRQRTKSIRVEVRFRLVKNLTELQDSSELFCPKDRSKRDG